MVVLDDSARTVAEAAAAVGVEPARILKSLVFLRASHRESGHTESAARMGRDSRWGALNDSEPVMVLCAGDRRVAAERLGLRPATAEEARSATGFAIGGIPPLGHDRELETLIDSSLSRFQTVWAAAGTPHAVFELSTAALVASIPGARVVEVA